MRILILFSFCMAFTAQAFDHSHQLWTDVLLKNLQQKNLNYSNLKSSHESLDQYLTSLSEVSKEDFEAWSEPEQIAFLVNAYNAFTVKLVATYYPVDSIKKIGGIFKFLPGLTAWDKNFILLFGENISLNHLEHHLLRKNYKEPRIHFALNCAALGSPALRPEAFQGSKLSNQLEEQMKMFLSEPEALNLSEESKVINLSSIFKWYESDFVAATGKSLKEYLGEYLQKNLDDYQMTFQDYDWSLNQIKGK